MPMPMFVVISKWFLSFVKHSAKLHFMQRTRDFATLHREHRCFSAACSGQWPLSSKRISSTGFTMCVLFAGLDFSNSGVLFIEGHPHFLVIFFACCHQCPCNF